jgi:hypothetical protein
MEPAGCSEAPHVRARDARRRTKAGQSRPRGVGPLIATSATSAPGEQQSRAAALFAAHSETVDAGSRMPAGQRMQGWPTQVANGSSALLLHAWTGSGGVDAVVTAFVLAASEHQLAP